MTEAPSDPVPAYRTTLLFLVLASVNNLNYMHHTHSFVTEAFLLLVPFSISTMLVSFSGALMRFNSVSLSSSKCKIMSRSQKAFPFGGWFVFKSL